MKTIEKFLLLIALAVAFLAIMVFPKAESAVTTTDISATQFNTLTSTYNAAFSVVYRGGSTLVGTGNEEIRLARNIVTPQVNGGSNTLIGNVTWSRPDQLELSIDGAGNISARAGSTIVSSLGFTVTRPFNQILIRVYDASLFGSSDLQDLVINQSEVRNMFANGTGANPSVDVMSISNFGTQAPFSFIANWDAGSTPLQNDQYVWIVALQNASIPEPSVTFLIGFISLLALRRRR